MRDGCYLSTFLTPPGLPRLANVWLRHDTNISLWEKSGSAIRLRRYWELERLTGVKYDGTALLDRRDARPLIDSLLASEGLGLDDLVEVWGTPQLATTDDYHLVDDLGDVAYHSACHLFSAILLDSELFNQGQILGLAVDGGPDSVLERTFKRKWYAGGVVRGGELTIFPIESPGTLWLQAHRRFGMREGSLMALATATEAAVHIDHGPILDRFTYEDSSVRRSAPAALDMVIEAVDAAIRAPGEGRFSGFDPRFTERENFVSAVMKEIQALSIAIMERNLEAALQRYRLDPSSTHLAMAGGFALNCPSNSHLMARYGFRGLLAPPVVSDTGQSLGIALGAFHKKLGGKPFSFRFPGPYLGDEDPNVEQRLEAHRDFVAEVADLDLDRAVADLERGPVVWFSGRAEIGPRALGARSILGDPRVLETKTALNRLKGREWWRPVAPVVLEEHLDEWFEDAHPSPYMLETFAIREHRVGSIPAVAHLDRSARVQSLSPAQNRPLHELLTGFHARTGVPLLCNTSLNDKGEPIVNDIDQALNFCLRKRVPVAYLNGRRVALGNFDRYHWSTPLPREDFLFAELSAEELAAARESLNRYGLPERYLHVYLWNPVLRAGFDLARERDVPRLRRAIELMFATYPDTVDRLENYLARVAEEYSELARYRPRRPSPTP